MILSNLLTRFKSLCSSNIKHIELNISSILFRFKNLDSLKNLIVQVSIISLFLLLLLFLEFEEKLNDFDEKVEEVHEQDHGMLGNVALAEDLAPLDDHLSVVHDVHAGDQEGDHQVAQSVH